MNTMTWTEAWMTDASIARMVFSWTPAELLADDEPLMVTISAVAGEGWMTILVDEIVVEFESDEQLLNVAAQFGVEIGWPVAA